jgi:hypothetical protein
VEDASLRAQFGKASLRRATALFREDIVTGQTIDLLEAHMRPL